MSIDPRIHSDAGAGARAAGSGSRENGPQGPESAESGAAFRALLERLEQNAEALDRATAELNDPAGLGQAVENARVSVEEALALGSDLLEAFRAAQQQAAGASTVTQVPPTDDASDEGLT